MWNCIPLKIPSIYPFLLVILERHNQSSLEVSVSRPHISLYVPCVVLEHLVWNQVSNPSLCLGYWVLSIGTITQSWTKFRSRVSGLEPSLGIGSKSRSRSRLSNKLSVLSQSRGLEYRLSSVQSQGSRIKRSISVWVSGFFGIEYQCVSSINTPYMSK